MQLDLDNQTKAKPIEGLQKSPKITINSDRLKKQHRLHALAVVLIPLVGSLVTVIMTLHYGISLVDLGLLVGMYTLGAIGITVGFHRHFAHCTFQTNTAVRVILAILGSMAGQGPPIYWVATHRRHHQYSDLIGDAHSPNLHGEGIKNKIQGLWHAHIGWIFDLEMTNTFLFAKDLLQDPAIAKVNQLYFFWVFLGLTIPAFLGGVLVQTWMGVLSGLLWGGFVRLFLSQNVTYAINSICHVYGSRSFDTREQSTNNIWLAIPTFGEAWHNNHHAFPNSAIFGLERWQIDLGGWTIRVLEAVGLIWNTKIPTAAMIEAKKSP